MKKKLLPFILGCAMVAAMPLIAHADPEVPSVPAGALDSKNGFANFESTGTLGGTANRDLEGTIFTDSTTTGSSLGNTRSGQSDMTGYAATYNNEKGANFTEADPNTNNDGFSDTTPSPRTDLETFVPGFTMTIPSKTMLPLGATKWNIGLLEINGENFVNPDKVGVIVIKDDFVKSGITPASATTNQKIIFDVKASDSGSPDIDIDSTSIVSTYNSVDGFTTDNDKILRFYKNGVRGTNFPYTYDMTGSDTDYDAGETVPIHEGRHIWVETASGAWANKEPGRYEGSITFTAYIISGELVENDDVTTAPYPKLITEDPSTHAITVTDWNADTPAS